MTFSFILFIFIFLVSCYPCSFYRHIGWDLHGMIVKETWVFWRSSMKRFYIHNHMSSHTWSYMTTCLLTNLLSPLPIDKDFKRACNKLTEINFLVTRVGLLQRILWRMFFLHPDIFTILTFFSPFSVKNFKLLMWRVCFQKTLV